ncbi:MAG TPA: heme exporter protein CcmB [Candidatus Tectomicrobia bacterium]|nr:heme exporter protein CcmB [Candidatus Tectomicrobia bacterium]
MAVWRTAYFLLAKDLLVELRTRETFTVMLFFAVVILFLFHFGLNPERENTAQLAPGLLWLAFLFTGVLGLGRSFQAEQANDCLEQLLLIPGDRGNIFLGKLIGNVAFMLAVELLIIPLFALFFQLNLWDALLPLLAVALLGTLGFAVIGTLFSALTANLRAREVLFPLLLFPLVVPVIIGSVTATGVILGGGTLGEASGWLKLLGAFDTIFLAVAYLSFELVVEQ